MGKVGTMDVFEALGARRTRRVATGMRIPAGPLADPASIGATPARPLSEEEVAALVFAASGLSGGALLDWDWSPGGAGSSLCNVRGRTVPSAEAVHGTALFVIGDDGVWLMPRPQDVEEGAARTAVEAAAVGDYLSAWRALRIRIRDGRPQPSVEFPHAVNGNRWSSSAAGTTTFLPVIENTALSINVMFELLTERHRAMALDDRDLFRPAGLGPFARRRGGPLSDDPRTLRPLPLSLGDRIVQEMGIAEASAMIQNLSLAVESMGLAGSVQYAYGDLSVDQPTWFTELGFTMAEQPLSALFGLPRVVAAGLRLARGRIRVRYPVGLEVDGRTVLASHRPPYYASMRDAVAAVARRKTGEGGALTSGAREGGALTSGAREGRFLDPEGFAAQVPETDGIGFEATVALCEHIWREHGRFPLHIAPFHTLLAYQVGHADLGFYERHYRPDALGAAHREHDAVWHAARPAPVA